MKIIFPVLIAIVVLSACQPEKESSSESKDPILDKSFYYAAGKSSGSGEYLYMLVEFKSPNHFKYTNAWIKTGSMSAIYRSEEGTFTKSGSSFQFATTKSTCPASSSFTYEINGDPADALVMKDSSGTSVKFLNASKYTPIAFNPANVTIAQEDTGCTLMAGTRPVSPSNAAGVESKSGRSPASAPKWAK